MLDLRESSRPTSTVGPKRGGTSPDWRALYDDWYCAVEGAYSLLGHSLGFNPPITSSIRAFEASPGILLMGLNPAGDRDYPEHRGRLRYEVHDLYLGTRWNDLGAGEAPLQAQVKQLLEHLRRRVGDQRPLEVFACQGVVSASLIPFRSPGWDRLHNRSMSLGFARRLWQDVLASWRPRYAICFGTQPFSELCSLFGKQVESRDYDPQWQGSLRLRVFESGTRLLGIPHMSRFPIFGRNQSSPAIEASLDDLLCVCST